MLALSSNPTRLQIGCCHIDIDHTVVRLAITYVAEESGWKVCTDPGCGCIRVASRVPREPGGLTVLVARSEPAAYQQAVQAVVASKVRAVVPWDRPELLPSTLDAVAAGMVLLPAAVIDHAALAPSLNDRLAKTLRLVAAGRSNPQIAAALHESESTAKRDVAELLALFDAPNRAALMAAAARLGYS